MSETRKLYRPYGRLDWSQAGGPRAVQHGDVYFSAQDGLAEARAVFLKGCDVDSLFQTRTVSVIGELGFGTGLNFLAAWQRFRETAPDKARLHFASLEGFPLSVEDAERALSAWPELADLAHMLIKAWPSPRLGPHRRIFDKGQVTLTVFHDEADAALANMDMKADAWFLDGFSPALNPDMWTGALFDQIARSSRPGTKAATFTVAGDVRRGLQAVGFEVSKQTGFGKKRERLEAVYQSGNHSEVQHASPHSSPPPVILGGGIAAASLTMAFRRRGIDPVVIAEGGWAAGASGAPRGLLTPRLEAADRPHVRALINAFEFAASLYADSPDFEQSGVLRIDGDPDSDRMQRLADLMGSGYSCGRHVHGKSGLWMEDAGHFDPAGLIRHWVESYPARDHKIEKIEQTGSGWNLKDGKGRTIETAGSLFMAGGAGLAGFDDLTGMATELTGGQLLVSDNKTGLDIPIAGPSYLIPMADDQMLMGATHEKNILMSQEDAEAYLRDQVRKLTGLESASIGQSGQVWQGWRASYNDRLPVMGPVPDQTEEGYQSGLFVLGGLGARGFAHAPLLAEALVSQYLGEPSPLERSAQGFLEVNRFRLRALRRS